MSPLSNMYFFTFVCTIVCLNSEMGEDKGGGCMRSILIYTIENI